MMTRSILATSCVHNCTSGKKASEFDFARFRATVVCIAHTWFAKAARFRISLETNRGIPSRKKMLQTFPFTNLQDKSMLSAVHLAKSTARFFYNL